MLNDARFQLLLGLEVVLISSLSLLSSLLDLAPIIRCIIRCVAKELILLCDHCLLNFVTGLDWALMEGLVKTVIVHLIFSSSVPAVDFAARLIQALALIGT